MIQLFFTIRFGVSFLDRLNDLFPEFLLHFASLIRTHRWVCGIEIDCQQVFSLLVLPRDLDFHTPWGPTRDIKSIILTVAQAPLDVWQLPAENRCQRFDTLRRFKLDSAFHIITVVIWATRSCPDPSKRLLDPLKPHSSLHCISDQDTIGHSTGMRFELGLVECSCQFIVGNVR